MENLSHEKIVSIVRIYRISRIVTLVISSLFGILAILSFISLILIQLGIVPAATGINLPVSQVLVQIFIILLLTILSAPGFFSFFKKSPRWLMIQGLTYGLMILLLPFIVGVPAVAYLAVTALGAFGLWLVMFLRNPVVLHVLNQ